MAKMNCTLTKSSELVKANDAITVTGLSKEKLEISFHRTIRVPDGDGDSELPPSMGTFPLYSVANHKDKLPAAMALKGGLFLPMYRELRPSPKLSAARLILPRARSYVD